MWTPNGLTPYTACPHGIWLGEDAYCPVCHHTGIDDHPLLQRSRATDPEPEPKPPPIPEKKLTRRERRKLMYEAKRAMVDKFKSVA